jgi:hypothetical protein
MKNRFSPPTSNNTKTHDDHQNQKTSPYVASSTTKIIPMLHIKYDVDSNKLNRVVHQKASLPKAYNKQHNIHQPCQVRPMQKFTTHQSEPNISSQQAQSEKNALKQSSSDAFLYSHSMTKHSKKQNREKKYRHFLLKEALQYELEDHHTDLDSDEISFSKLQAQTIEEENKQYDIWLNYQTEQNTYTDDSNESEHNDTAGEKNQEEDYYANLYEDIKYFHDVQTNEELAKKAAEERSERERKEREQSNTLQRQQQKMQMLKDSFNKRVNEAIIEAEKEEQKSSAYEINYKQFNSSKKHYEFFNHHNRQKSKSSSRGHQVVVKQKKR